MFEVKECNELEIIRSLFREYSKMDGAERCFVSFENELEHLGEVYAGGALLVGFCDNIPIGCVGVKKIKASVCEMKRLFVQPPYRGNGYAHELIKQAKLQAKSLKFTYIELETIPTVMNEAYQMYLKLGFQVKKEEDGVTQMKLSLQS